jgi:hypothetical protein
MGFFSFIGKAAKSIAHVVGGVARVAAPLALGGPLGGLAGGVLGHLLHSKSPMSSGPLKINVGGRSIPILRGKTPNPMIRSSAAVLRQTPMMPGGSIATPQGIMASGGGLPPATYGGRKTSGGLGKKKRRSSSSRSSSRSRSGKKRTSGGRKLKFGSPAWRKKYMKRRGR